MKAHIFVTLKQGVLDPQGSTVQRSLQQMGYAAVQSVRIGKFMEVELAGTDREAAATQVDEMCRKLFVNPNIEEYRFELR
ncbi:MAG: phosphoribosylformylglycinamidine synthase subunit PurS [bacterium]|nr:phosphoribosylformylglycinamidine synthase subunit PurS [bacterium]